jgi:two-component system response regulator
MTDSVTATVGPPHTRTLGRTPRLLLIEDNPLHILLTQEAIRDMATREQMVIIEDGDEALEYLQKCGNERDHSVPDLILLDLNLPGRDGRELLTHIKQHPRLRRIPTIILSTSGYVRDVTAAYQLHANCYISKPVNVDEYIRTVEEIQSFWLGRTLLPDA